jgi:hypothetical protein
MNWKIEQIWVRPLDGDFANVVVTAAWRCTAEQVEDGKTYSGTCYGTASFNPADPADFIPLVDLTEADVLGWVWSAGIDKAATEASVQQQIDNQITPPIVVPPLPWAV